WICTIPLAHPRPRNTVSSEKARAVTRELTPAIWINVFFVIASTTCTCPRCWPMATLVPSAVAAAAEARLELSTGSSTFKPEARSATRTALSVTTTAFGVFDATADCSNGGRRDGHPDHGARGDRAHRDHGQRERIGSRDVDFALHLYRPVLDLLLPARLRLLPGPRPDHLPLRREVRRASAFRRFPGPLRLLRGPGNGLELERPEAPGVREHRFQPRQILQRPS